MKPIERLQKGINKMTHTDPSYLDYLDYIDHVNHSLADDVNSPQHYMLLPGVEVRDVIAALTEKIELSDVMFSGQNYGDYIQMMQYCMRFMGKGGCKDLEKARWYLDKLIEDYND